MTKYPTPWHEKYFHSERIEMLTDGVYAIVLTLLVLDLRIPNLKDANDMHELWVETKKMLPHFWSFLITFLWIANSWVSNQSYNRLVIHRDPVVIWLNIYMLLMICIFPFPTALIGEYPHNPLGVFYFGVIVIISSFGVIAITQYTVRKNLISPHVDLDALKKRVNMIPKLLPVYFIPLGIAFFLPVVAQVIYFALSITWIFQTSSWKLREVE